MAVENDILTGLDISALTSVEQSQLLQMINQAAPLVNKGLIISQSTTPDIANNARYSRYIWLDTTTNPPTPKIYDGAVWQSLILADGSITNVKVNAAAAIAITKLAFGTARYIVRTNGAGNALEFCNPNALFTNNDVPVTAIDITGAPATVRSYLQRDAGGAITAWKQIAFTDFAAGDLIGVNKINSSGVNNQVLATVTGVTTWADLVSLIADNTIGAAKLTGAANALQTIRRNSTNTANEWATPILSKEFIVTSNDLGTDFNLGAPRRQVYAHGLGAIPKLVRGVLICSTGELGYSINDEVDIDALYKGVAAGDDQGRPIFAVIADNVNITVACDDHAGGTLLLTAQKTPGAAAAITRANWKVKVYAWL